MNDELKKKIQEKIDKGAKTIGGVDVETLKKVIDRKKKTVVK